ncbi:MAG TPA: hypothetical protein VFE98_03335 [Candidatus Bathyarchaeia archaeon]|nr:hypothetical protein [Candidatus Bathyarchaeia archaeon]
MLIEAVDYSKVPLAEEETRFSSIRAKVRKGLPLTSEEHNFLERLASKAKEWEAGIKNSKDTDPNDTLSG